MPSPDSKPASRYSKLAVLSLAALIILVILALSCGATEESTAPLAPATKAPDAKPAPAATTAPEPTSAPEPTTAPQRATESGRKFDVVSGSQGLFKVDETLRGLDIVVALETSELTGNIDLEAGTAVLELDLHSLKSDQPRRDRYVREQLFPSQPITTVEFVTLGDIPDSFFGTGEEFMTTLPATVNVNGVSAELKFEITARLDSDEDLVVLGVTEFTWADFGMTAPVSGFFSVADEVRAELLLQAKAN